MPPFSLLLPLPSSPTALPPTSPVLSSSSHPPPPAFSSRDAAVAVLFAPGCRPPTASFSSPVILFFFRSSFCCSGKRARILCRRLRLSAPSVASESPASLSASSFLADDHGCRPRLFSLFLLRRNPPAPPPSSPPSLPFSFTSDHPRPRAFSLSAVSRMHHRRRSCLRLRLPPKNRRGRRVFTPLPDPILLPWRLPSAAMAGSLASIFHALPLFFVSTVDLLRRSRCHRPFLLPPSALVDLVVRLKKTIKAKEFWEPVTSEPLGSSRISLGSALE